MTLSSAYLEDFPEPGGPAQRILLETFPFRIGRSASAQYTIYSLKVSKEHTEILMLGNEYRIRDLGSTNGTFVNGQRIEEVSLANGDIIHVAHKELRFGIGTAIGEDAETTAATQKADSRLPVSVILGNKHLREMLTQKTARIVFQSILRLDDRTTLGFEALARGTHQELTPNPAELFLLAAQCNLAGELSRMFRELAAAEAASLPLDAHFFFNVHSAEMFKSEIVLASLRGLKEVVRETQSVVMEVHEGIVTDLPTLRWLRSQLNDLGIGLAYDDFGAGQSRLAELAEIPPDFIKLDLQLIRGIHEAPARQELISALNRVARDLGVKVIAEGIESQDEAKTCLDLGCQFGQGYLFGRPEAIGG